ncbi:MAG TPA: hypothetical protein VNY84_00065, partial [Acidimicrobiales bacterium]|nr:hypothetical protein [Acidimicrobiales bacterium]
NHQPIGVGVYDTKVGDIGSPNLQTDLWDIDALPTNINVTFADRGKGPWPANDAVVVKAPAFSVPGFSFSAGATGPPPADTSFILSYSMTIAGVITDVTSAVTSAAGLPLTLGRDGTLPQTLVVTAKTSTGAPAGHPGYVDISVSSTNSTPPGLSDNVLIQLYSTGQSQLRFAGLPQPEPMDITQSLTAAELAARTGPFPSVGYAPGAFYGAFPDATGQKFAYVSAWDNFGFQVFGNKVSATAYRVQMVDPATTCTPEAGGAFGCNVGPGLPAWERSAFGQPYSDHQVPGGIGQYMDPLGGNGMNGLGGTPVNLHPKIMAGGQDVTAAVEAGTYTTPSLGTYQTTDLTVSFSPPAGDSQRYSPLKFNLINASTGEVEDVMVIGLSTIFSCTSDGGGQQLATITGPSGQKEHLSFRAFDRTGTSGAIDCLQHLSHSWISKVPVVFSSYVPATANTGAGGDNPNGLWLAPQFGALIRVDTDTLRVTSTYAKSYVDTPILGDDGQPDPSVPSPAYDYVGDFPNLVWNTTDGTNGLPVNANSPMGASPFPLIQPSQNEWPNNTMAAQRYFQVDTVTGTPLMVGEMRINEPWYQGDIPFLMPVDNTTGLTLAYGAPVNVTASLPGDNSTTTYGMYWVTRKDGTVIQGGCLGLPPAFFNLLHVDKSICFIGVTTTFKPIPSDPSQEAKIAQVTIFLKPVGFVVGTPEFNLKNLAGQIDLDPASGQVQDVKLEANFGVGPPTPCQVEKNARKAAGIAPTVEQRIQGSSCPSNYFFYNAKITFKQGGFTSDNATTGYGIRFDGTLSLFGDFNLSNIVADISTSPFNFHF